MEGFNFQLIFSNVMLFKSSLSILRLITLIENLPKLFKFFGKVILILVIIQFGKQNSGVFT
jgi:hypothetical protein